MTHRHTEAADRYQQVFERAQHLGIGSWQFEALQGLGRLQQDIGKPHLGLTYHERALRLATGLARSADQARAHDGLAHAYDALGDAEKARSHWQLALDILTQLGTEHTEEAQVSVPNLRAQLTRHGCR